MTRRQVFTWGRGQWGELGIGEVLERNNHPKAIVGDVVGDVVGVACGHFHTLLWVEGKVFVCGAGIGGQLATGQAENELVCVEAVHLRGRKVSSLAAGRTVTAAVLDDEAVVHTWGKMTNGQLGHSDTSDQLEPRPLSHLCRRPFRIVSCGESHCVAISQDNRVYTWGRAINHRTFGVGCRNESLICSPAVVDELRHVKAVDASCGHFHSVIVDSEGKVHTSGWNFYGQLGQGNAAPTAKICPLPTLEREVVVKAACGAHHTLLLTETGEVFAFGCNLNGELGVGSQEEVDYIATPMLVSALMGEKIVAIGCGAYHSAAVTESGQMYCWGSNAYGQLGIPSYVGMDEPQRVARLPDGCRVVDVSCGSYHTAVVVELAD